MEFLRRWSGKKIMFVGDSLSLNMWESLACMVHASVPSTKSSFVRKDSLSSVTFEVRYFYLFLFFCSIIEANLFIELHACLLCTILFLLTPVTPGPLKNVLFPTIIFRLPPVYISLSIFLLLTIIHCKCSSCRPVEMTKVKCSTKKKTNELCPFMPTFTQLEYRM